MMPYTDHNGKAQVMSREEFYSCGYIHPEKIVSALSGRYTVLEIAEIIGTYERRVEEIRAKLNIKVRARTPNQWTEDEDAVLRDCHTVVEAMQRLKRSYHACWGRTKLIGHRMKGKAWQTWELEMIRIGKSATYVSHMTGRSMNAVQKRMHKMI